MKAVKGTEHVCCLCVAHSYDNDLLILDQGISYIQRPIIKYQKFRIFWHNLK